MQEEFREIRAREYDTQDELKHGHGHVWAVPHS